MSDSPICRSGAAAGASAMILARLALRAPYANAASPAHESPRPTKLYDRTGDEITLDEVERIKI
jgi:hypothetical protein